MGQWVFSVVVLIFGVSAQALELKCIPVSELKMDGTPVYLFFDIATEKLNVLDVKMESLAEDGLYSVKTLELVGGIFVHRDVVSFETVADGAGLALRAVYMPSAQNYFGNVYFEASTEILQVKCMELKAI